MVSNKENAVRIGKLNVPYEPQEVHRHLVTLPTGGRFAIFDYPEPTARQLETLLVFDAHKKPDSTREAQRTVMGTVRLLPGPDGTTVVFDAKDAVWGQEITGEKRALFYEYFQLVRAHFGVSEGCPASTEDSVELLSAEVQGSPAMAARAEYDALLAGRPWEKIPDHLWDRLAVRAWWQGHTYAEIARYNIGGVKEARVRNRLTELRGEHGEEIVPYYQQLKAWGVRE